VPTLLAGGVALLQAASPGAAVHMQDVVAATGAGVLYRQADELAAALASEVETGAAGRRAWAVRDAFTFDHHVEKLERLLRAAA
jgi:hypothetical protein